MADGRHLRNRKIAISQERFDEDLHDNVTVPRLGNLGAGWAVAHPTITLGGQPMYSAHPRNFPNIYPVDRTNKLSDIDLQ